MGPIDALLVVRLVGRDPFHREGGGAQPLRRRSGHPTAARMRAPSAKACLSACRVEGQDASLLSVALTALADGDHPSIGLTLLGGLSSRSARERSSRLSSLSPPPSSVRPTTS
jgi:hypothetical protein